MCWTWGAQTAFALDDCLDFPPRGTLLLFPNALVRVQVWVCPVLGLASQLVREKLLALCEANPVLFVAGVGACDGGSACGQYSAVENMLACMGVCVMMWLQMGWEKEWVVCE